MDGWFRVCAYVGGGWVRCPAGAGTTCRRASHDARAGPKSGTDTGRSYRKAGAAGRHTGAVNRQTFGIG